MLINNINISTYGATLIDRTFTNHSITNVNDWIDGASAPVFLREFTRYKEIDLVFLFEGSESAIISNIDRFVKEVRTSTISFTDLDYYYDVHLEGSISTDKQNNRSYIVKVKLKAHRTYKTEWSMVVSSLEHSIINEGSLPGPMRITIKPSIDLSTFTIDGLSNKPITLNNLVAGSTYVIDGYKTRYLKDGASDMGNYAAFEFPQLQPGMNNIAFTSDQAVITLESYPLFN